MALQGQLSPFLGETLVDADYRWGYCGMFADTAAPAAGWSRNRHRNPRQTQVLGSLLRRVEGLAVYRHASHERPGQGHSRA